MQVKRHRNGATAAVLALALLFLGTENAAAQSGTLSEVTVHGRSLEGNLLGDAADRSVYVYLPPSYATDSARRYPVLYLLHGIGDPNTVWVQAWDEKNDGYATIQDLMDQGVQGHDIEEMIVIMPDARTAFYGCFYTNSPVKGNWTDFIANDLVAYVDEHYRTIERREARGLAGHSMGGHGALKIGMLRPDVFSVVYGMNPAVLGWGADISASNPALGPLTDVKTPQDAMQQNLYVVAVIGIGQAFSPNLDNPPFLTDYPFAQTNGQLVDHGPGWERWQSQMPVYMVEKHADNARQLSAIRFDTAFVDEYTHIPETSKQLSDALTAAGIDHTFETYNGDHRNRLWGRYGRLFTEVLPYFTDFLISERTGDSDEKSATRREE
jgi:enterochelin esterase-like enzyme